MLELAAELKAIWFLFAAINSFGEKKSMSNWNNLQTPSFAISEMACKCGKCGGLALMDHEFMLKLQDMRHSLGRPMVIASGYRCRQHPVEARKSAPGAHARGMAADIQVRGGAERLEMMMVGLECGMRSFGVAKGFVHVDTSDHRGADMLWSYD